MSRLLNMRIEARAEAQRQMDAILDRAADENGRDLTEAEDAELESFRSDIEKLDASIEKLQKDNERSQNAPQPVNIPRKDAPTSGKDGQVNVRSEPGPYGDGPAGLRRFLVDSAVAANLYQSSRSEHAPAAAAERLAKWTQHVAQNEEQDINARAVAMSNLAGIVNPQFDPSRVSRGIYDVGVTTMLLNRYPIFAEGDSITMPRVTTEAVAAIQAEGTAFNDTSTRTTGVKADLFTVAAKTEVSVQSIERGNMSLELLQDELRNSWMANLNQHTLYGDGTTGDEPSGLLNQTAARVASNYIIKTDASAEAIKQLGYLTDLKTAIWKADRRRADAYIVGPDAVGDWENANENGVFIIPPYANWAYNVGGAGTLPEREGPMSEFDWRRVPVYVDPAIGQNFAADGTLGTGNNNVQSRYLGMVRGEVPIFYDGPMTYTYEQTLAASGQVLLVVRGYAAFNPEWRPEAWRVIHGTGTVTV